MRRVSCISSAEAHVCEYVWKWNQGAKQNPKGLVRYLQKQIKKKGTAKADQSKAVLNTQKVQGSSSKQKYLQQRGKQV